MTGFDFMDDEIPKVEDAGLIEDGLAVKLLYARDVIQAFDTEIDLLIGEAKAFEIKTDADKKEAVGRAGNVKGLKKRLEDRRKQIILEPDDFVRKVNAAVKSRRDKIDEIERIYKSKIADHAYREELARRELIKKQEDERAKLQAKINAEAEKMGVESVEVAPVAIMQKQGPTRADGASASTIMVWDFEIMDDSKIPRIYLKADDAAIRAAIKAGIREMPGVRIFEKAEIRVRRV